MSTLKLLIVVVAMLFASMTQLLYAQREPTRAVSFVTTGKPASMILDTIKKKHPYDASAVGWDKQKNYWQTPEQVNKLNQQIADIQTKIQHLPPNILQQLGDNALLKDLKIEAIDEQDAKALGKYLNDMNIAIQSNSDAQRLNDIGNKIDQVKSTFGRLIHITLQDFVGIGTENTKTHYLLSDIFYQFSTLNTAFPIEDAAIVKEYGTHFEQTLPNKTCHVFVLKQIDGRDTVIAYEEVSLGEIDVIMTIVYDR